MIINASDIPLAVAQAAYSGISMTPERRAQQEQAEYVRVLTADYEHLQSLIVEQLPELRAHLQLALDAEFERYRQGYRKRLLAWLHSYSRCVSVLITGPANFPTARNEKRNNAAHKRLEELIDYRKRALAAITKTLRPDLRPIMAGDSDAVESLQKKIDEADKLHSQMLAVNTAHKAYLKNPASLDASSLPDSIKERIRVYTPEYSWLPHPIAPWQLTNSGANLRRMRERLEGLKRSKAAPVQQVEGANARLEDCPPDNRVRLFFPGKPEATVRERLKRAGFRWTPSLECWQAYRNSNSISTAKAVAGLEVAA